MGQSREECWFQLPQSYWHDGRYEDLSLPAKVMLLITLTRPERFQLLEGRAPQWYGVSEDSAGDGLRELIAKNLLLREERWEEDPRSDSG
ncbi:MAG: hypothetical protein ACRDTT_34995 [Pseudonocardiaceae bacterium]